MTLVLSGCAQQPTKEIAIMEQNKNLVCKVPFEPTMPNGFTWRPIEFKVITPETMYNLVNEKHDKVYFALTVKDYEELSYNMTDIKRVLDQNKTLLYELNEYYKSEDE